jgi:hypothetical protein
VAARSDMPDRPYEFGRTVSVVPEGHTGYQMKTSRYFHLCPV